MPSSHPRHHVRLIKFVLFSAGRCGMLLAILGLAACRRAAVSRPRAKSSPQTPDGALSTHSAPSLPEFAVEAVATHEGEAFWYDVPAQSLPQRRAWTGELTAASDSLPLDSYARVRRLDGNPPAKTVIVRITDSGIHQKGGIIDLNHDAAEALDIIKSGQARVRVETLALRNASTDKPVDKKDAPTAPKASAIDGEPAAGLQAEKDAAHAKAGGRSAP